MKFKAPPQCTAVVYGGATIPVAPDGSIEADETAAPHLRAHGIDPWIEPPPQHPARRRAPRARKL